MSKLTMSDIQEENKDFMPTINPGVHEVELMDLDIREKDNPEKTTDVTLKMANVYGNMEFTFHNYITPGAMKYNLLKAKHIAKIALTETEQSKINGENEEELLVSMLSAVKGKKIRMLFGGEEYVRDGELKVKTTVGLPNFAESTLIPEAESALRYDPSNKWHYKKVPQEVLEMSGLKNKQESMQKELDGNAF